MEVPGVSRSDLSKVTNFVDEVARDLGISKNNWFSTLKSLKIIDS